MSGIFAQLKALGSANVWMVLDFVMLAPCFVAAIFFARSEGRWRRVASAWKRWLERGVTSGSGAPVLAFAAAVSLCAIASGFSWPLPKIHDEFSYLLQADTFAAGRIVNPTPEHWEFFETFHVIVQPFYASKYPPGQGALLALGQVIVSPGLGAWLGLAAAAAAICWMLRGVFSGGVAFAGAIAFVSVGRILLAFGMSFMGGGLVTCGGALVLGGLMRAAKEPRVVDGVVAGLGAGILVLTRPFEGLVVVVAGALASKWSRRFLFRFVAPFALVSLCACGLMLAYNQGVTGDLRLLPYTVYDEQNDTARVFFFQEARPMPLHNHREQIRFAQEQQLQQQQKREAPLTTVVTKLGYYARFFLGAGWIFPLLVGARRLRERVARIAAVVFAASVAMLMLVTYEQPHYLAAGASGLIVIVTMGMRDLLASSQWRARAIGLASLMVIATGPALALGWQYFRPQSAFEIRRQSVTRELLSEPGKHLVFVRYSPTHNTHEEWVYNGALLEQTPILWVRDMGDASNAAFAESFNDRSAWVIEPDRPNGDQSLTRLRTNL